MDIKMTHTSLEELSARLVQAKERVEVGAHYYHYRNPEKYYKVIAIGLSEETEEPVVIYKALSGLDMIWTRPVSVWTQIIEQDDKKVPRFQKISLTAVNPKVVI